MVLGLHAEHRVVYLRAPPKNHFKSPGTIRFKIPGPLHLKPAFHHTIPHRHFKQYPKFHRPLSGEEKYFHGIEQPYHAVKKPEIFHSTDDFNHHNIEQSHHEIETHEIESGLDLEDELNEDAHAEITSSSAETLPRSSGEYDFGFETSNGIIRHESGYAGEYVKGFSQYISPEGELVTMKYVADENGFHVEGSHIPTPPPHVAETLAWNAAHPEEDHEEEKVESYYEL